jgi:hypothetical protein
MTKWEYKIVSVNRSGRQEEFGYTWTYTPWEMLGTGQTGGQSIQTGLDELGRQGWELAGILPTDLWTEGTRSANSSHGTRTISCTLLLKRPIEEAAQPSGPA